MQNLIESSFVGPLHNQILQDITQLSNFPNFTDLETYNVAKRNVELYYLNNDLNSPFILSFEACQECVDRVIANGYDMTNLYIELEANGDINQTQLNYLLLINDLLLNANDPNRLADNMFQITQELIVTESLSLIEKNLIYGTAIIGFNSGYYWYSAYSTPSNPWNVITNSTIKAEEPKWWQRAARDCAGFVLGWNVGLEFSGGDVDAALECATITASASSAAKN
jgi:hypothetical protein